MVHSHRRDPTNRRSRPGTSLQRTARRSAHRSIEGIRRHARRPNPGIAQEGHPLATASETTKLRPLGDRVVIKPSPREEVTKSGIVLPDTAKEKPQEGSALAVGPGRILEDGSREKMDVAVGDKVLYAKYAGTEFKVNGEDLLIVSQKDILAIVED
jgi:chaperonin GroES